MHFGLLPHHVLQQIKHLEVDPVPEVADTCLGFTVVAMAEVFSELEKRDEEVGIRIPSSL